MGLLGHLGRNARDPHVAGLVIMAGAGVFSVLWLRLAFPPAMPVVFRPILFPVVASLNAYVATRLVWWRFVPSAGEFSLGRGALVGIGLGLFSMFTLSGLGFPLIWILDWIIAQITAFTLGAEVVELLEVIVSVGVVELLEWIAVLVWLVIWLGSLGTVVGLLLTWGIPLAITTGGAVGLAYLEKRYA